MISYALLFYRNVVTMLPYFEEHLSLAAYGGVLDNWAAKWRIQIKLYKGMIQTIE